MAGTRCSKCKINKHKLFGCKEKWPYHTAQECDRCGGEHETGQKGVCKQSEDIRMCSICGHEGHHNKAQCDIKDPSNDDHLRQWTKSKFDEYMKKNPKRRDTFVGDPTQTTGSQDPTEQLETELPITPFNYTAPAPTPEQAQKLAWAREAYDAVPFSANKTIKRDTEVEVNFLRLKFISKTLFHKYRIELGNLKGKPVKKEEVRKALVFKLLTVQRPPVLTAQWVSDFSTYIISTAPLYPEFGTHTDTRPSEPKSFKVPHRLSPIPGEVPAIMDTAFHYEGTFDKDVLMEYIKGMGNRQVSATVVRYHPDDDIRILNMISWKNINHPLIFGGGIVKKKFYPDPFSSAVPMYKPGETTPVYVVTRGYFSSVRPGVGLIEAQRSGAKATGNDRLFLNVNPTTSAFFPSVKLQDWLKARGSFGLNGNPDLDTQEEIIGRRVTFNGDPLDSKGKRKQRVIMGFEGKVGTKYFTKKGTNTSVLMLKHMKDTYGTGASRLKFDRDACCVQVGNPGNDKFYPADQLMIVPYQPVRKVLTSDFTDIMLKQAQKDPKENKDAIIFKAFGPLGLACPANVFPPPGTSASVPLPPNIEWDSAFFSRFGLDIDSQLLKVNARMLPAPTLKFQGNQKSSKVLKTKDNGFRGSWNLSGSKFLVPGKKVKLGFIKIGQVADDEIVTFAAQLHPALRSYGYEVDWDTQNNCFGYGIVDGGSIGDNRQTMSTNIINAYRGLDVDTSLLVFVLEKKDISAYSSIKWWAECSAGKANICLTAGVMNKKKKHSTDADPNMLANLSLKINFKLAGTAHQVQDSEEWGGALDNTMIVGADVTHPGKNMVCPSMAGVVATRGKNAFHYLASARLQRGTQEHIDGLDSMIEERLEAYYEQEGCVPSHILFYRDGVSESQFGMVKQKEIPLIRSGCIRWGKTKKKLNWTPKITLLVVGKRHHVRFFPPKPGTTKQDKNFQSGLVVDTVITSPYKCDFYLQGHDCALGTARTAHYIVLENESCYTMDKLEELTNNLCFLSARATRSLSVCTPARYADILCDRLRCYMKPYFRRQPQGNPITVDTCAQDISTWGRNRGTNGQRKNPWNNNVDDIMFYL